DRGRCARDFLHRDDVREVAHRGAAKLFLDRDAQQAQVAQLRPEVARKFVGAVDLRGARSNLTRGEPGYALAEDIRSFAQVEMEPRIHGLYQAKSGVIC